MKTRFVLGLCLCAVAVAAAAEPPAAPASPDIVVKGTTDKALDRFMKSASPTRNGGQIARWDDRICSTVINIDPDHAAMIKSKIDGAARDLHVSVAPSDRCRPNIAVVFTDASDELTKSVITRYSRDFLENQSSNTDFLGYKAIATIETPRPIRWLTVDGTKSGMDQVVASHIRLLTRRVIASTLIIVDIKRIDGLRWEQIGDYVTMVALANPKLGADYSGQDSILSLFSGDSTMAPAGLTANDRTLLTGLYSSKPNQTAENQRAEMRRARTRALKAGAKALPQDQ